MLDLDLELRQWVYGIFKMNAGSFLQTIAEAAQRADGENYEIIRPALLQLKKKYPHYHTEVES